MTLQYKDRNYDEFPFVIGTRGSPLAIAQAVETRKRLMKAHNFPDHFFKLEIIKTTGDKILDQPLSQVGGKGLFTKEIEEALLSKKIDIAVHSMKDMPTELPEGLRIAALLPREDVRDSFVSLKHKSLRDLPLGSTVGTSSLRRRAQLLAKRKDLKIVEFRGNVQTRLKKLDQGVAEATFLACAGLNRLDMKSLINPIEVTEMLPAVAQGAIGIEQRTGDDNTLELLSPINDKITEIQLNTERSFLAKLDGSCRTPIGGYATISDGIITFRGEILKPDGSQTFCDVWTGNEADAFEIGAEAGRILKEKGGEGFFS